MSTANPEALVVIRFQSDSTYDHWIVSLNDALDSNLPQTQLPSLKANDVLLVGRSGISNVNLWVEQYIRKVLPFNVGVNYPVGKNAD